MHFAHICFSHYYFWEFSFWTSQTHNVIGSEKRTHDIVLGFDFSGGSALYYVDKERPSHKKYCLPTLYSEHWLLGDILLSPLISSYYYEMILLHLVEAHKVFRFSMKYVYVTYLCCPHPRFGSSQSLMINGH